MATSKTLTLTSPPTKGPTVTAVQNLLRERGFLTGPADGVYGALTATAVRRAKYLYGFAGKDVTPAFTPIFGAYLKGTKTLPLLYRARRKVRLQLEERKKALANKRTDVLKLAISQIGTKEHPPESNEVLYSKWYGMTGSWCAMFVTWCATANHVKSFDRTKSRYAYVPYVLNDAVAGRNGLRVVHDPIPGDLVIYNWDHAGVPEHIGYFEEWTNQSAGQFRAIEGNTAVGNNSNGGEVMRRDRDTSMGVTFVRYEV